MMWQGTRARKRAQRNAGACSDENDVKWVLRACFLFVCNSTTRVLQYMFYLELSMCSIM
jgi:hypothetical protein